MRRLFAIVLAALALSACKVDVDVAVDVRADGSGTVTVTALADGELVTATPGLVDDLRFEDAVAAGWTVDGPSNTTGGGLRVVLSHTFDSAAEGTALLRSINGTGGPVHDVAIALDGSSVALTGSLRVDGGLNAFADPEVLAAIGGSPYADDLAAANLRPADALALTFAVTFPGAVGTTTGTKGGNTVTWTVPLDQTSLDLATSSKVDAPRDSTWSTVATVALGLLVLWVVLATTFIVWVMVQRRKRARRRAARV